MMFHSFDTILLSFLGCLSCSCFWARPSDQKLCHALTGAVKGLPEALPEELCEGCSAAGAADAALEALGTKCLSPLPLL